METIVIKDSGAGLVSRRIKEYLVHWQATNHREQTFSGRIVLITDFRIGSETLLEKAEEALKNKMKFDSYTKFRILSFSHFE